MILQTNRSTGLVPRCSFHRLVVNLKPFLASSLRSDAFFLKPEMTFNLKLFFKNSIFLRFSVSVNAGHLTSLFLVSKFSLKTETPHGDWWKFVVCKFRLLYYDALRCASRRLLVFPPLSLYLSLLVDATFLRSSTCCSRWTEVCGEGFWLVFA